MSVARVVNMLSVIYGVIVWCVALLMASGPAMMCVTLVVVRRQRPPRSYALSTKYCGASLLSMRHILQVRRTSTQRAHKHLGEH